MTKRREEKLRIELADLQKRYDYARHLGRQLEMARLSRRMISINVALLRAECPKRKRAA